MASQNIEAVEAWKKFLESTPAYVDQQFENLIQDIAPTGPVVYGIYLPVIKLYCEVDDGVRGCNPDQQKIGCGDYRTQFVRYTCRDCGRWGKTFALILVPDVKSSQKVLTAMKLGEYPPFGSHLAKRLEKLLSASDLELYRKGIRCEREGQGIGAAAYFRRVVDYQWKKLVEKLRDAAKRLGAPPETVKVFDDALTQPQFSTAVGLLKDVIPAKLLILDGKNPLTLLYKPLSVQLHDLSDKECLQQATDIRIILNETFDNINRVLSDDEMLKAAVTRLSEGV
jgi:hypothetical protein